MREHSGTLACAVCGPVSQGAVGAGFAQRENVSSCAQDARAACAQVPYTDAFMLRTFSADAPLEGRSSFAVEMVEMRCAGGLAHAACTAAGCLC